MLYLPVAMVEAEREIHSGPVQHNEGETMVSKVAFIEHSILYAVLLVLLYREDFSMEKMSARPEVIC